MKREAIRRSVDRFEGGRGLRRTGNSEDDRHKDSDKVVDDFKHWPFLGAKKFPGPWGENEGVPSGDGQGAHEEVLVCGQVGWKLEGVWKQACVRFAVSSRGEMRVFWGRTDNVGHGCEGESTTEGGEGSRRVKARF